MAGKNRALSYNENHVIYESEIRGGTGKKCVFISHRSTDKKAAEAVAEYLKENDIDVYLDKYDQELQNADRANDAKAVVEHIERGLSVSTHILTLISPETRESWWVPYEVGYGKKGGKRIASAILKNYINGDFPDYLKIERMIKSPGEFSEYVKEIKGRSGRYGALFENVTMKPEATEPTILNDYIRSVE